METPRDLKKDPMFFYSRNKLHVVVEIIPSETTWDLNIMHCGRKAMTGSSAGVIFEQDHWCEDCKAYYEQQLKEGSMPNRYFLGNNS